MHIPGHFNVESESDITFAAMIIGEALLLYRGDGLLHFTDWSRDVYSEEEGGGRYHFVTGCYVD